MLRLFKLGLVPGLLMLLMTSGRGQEQILGEPEESGPSWLEQDGATGDWLGLRMSLQDRGIEFFGGYTTEVWGNTTGGIKTGTNYTGLLDFGLNVDLEKAAGWSGASVETTWLWLSGRDTSEDLVGNNLTISNISGFNTLRLFELWFQQNLLEDRISFRIGQLSADSEFIISDYAGVFLNGTFGWPAFMSMNLPEGGPAYPMGTLGARLALTPVDWFTFQTAVFQGNVFAQDVNRHGLRWRLDAVTGFTFLNEAQVRWNQNDEARGLPGQGKLGAWFQSGQNADILDDSTSSGNVGIYGIIDQMLFRERGAEIPAQSGLSKDGNSVADGKDSKNFQTPVNYEKSDQGLGWFGRISFAPSDRNFVNFYIDTGLSYQGLIPGRDDDTLGLAFAYAQSSPGARGGLRDEGSSPVGGEMVIELTYQVQVTKWFTVQPDLQFIINPGGTSDFANALVLGGRATIVF